MNIKPIVLRYKINGVNMKRTYARERYREAAVRAGVLRDSGIPVVVRGMPKRINVEVQNDQA